MTTIRHEAVAHHDDGTSYRLGGETYETDLEGGALYRAHERAHGRCTGRVYVDRKHAVMSDPTSGAFAFEAMPVGWVFVKRLPFDDTPRRSYLHETWITVEVTA